MQNFGEAFDDMIRKARWRTKFHKANLKEDWEKLFGSMIARYTDDIKLIGKKLIVTVSNSALRQELFNQKEKIIYQINHHYNEEIVQEIVLK